MLDECPRCRLWVLDAGWGPGCRISPWGTLYSVFFFTLRVALVTFLIAVTKYLKRSNVGGGGKGQLWLIVPGNSTALHGREGMVAGGQLVTCIKGQKAEAE